MTASLDICINHSEPSSISVNAVYDALAQDGFRPEVDSDGDIKFKWEGRLYYIRLQEGDLSFLRICAINIAPSLKDAALAVQCCNTVNSDVKVAKAFCVQRNGLPVIWVNAECRYNSTTSFMQQLLDLLGGVRAGVNHFHDALSTESNLVVSDETPIISTLN